RLRGDDEPSGLRGRRTFGLAGTTNLRALYRQAKLHGAKLASRKPRRSRGGGNPASSLERAAGSPPSRGRRPSVALPSRKAPWRETRVTQAPSFPRRREPSVFARMRRWVPAFAGTTNLRALYS